MPDDKPLDMTDAACSDALDRIGMARLAKLAFDGADLRPMWAEVSARLLNGEADEGEGMDLSLIAQLLGHKQTGLSIQQEVLASRRLFRLPCLSQAPRMRVLALAAATDMGSNTPIEFLLKDFAIELMVLYVIAEVELPMPLPEHDIAIVIASDSDDCRDALHKIAEAAPRWPRPLLNPPQRIGNLDRDKLHRLLAGIEGLVIPATIPCAREELVEAIEPMEAPPERAGMPVFPVIIRPRGSHAGVGLAKIDDVPAMLRYLEQSKAQEFFVARFVDYAGEDGLFRKYRIVFVDGQPYACHMAVADRWDIWYLNAGMSGDAGKRLEEATFMSTFDIAFARRHRSALAAMAERVGLDYFIVDCAETRDGSLLIFEADNTAVVHNMDQPELFPYKPPQMRRIFDAFVAMLERRVARARERAA
jgi:glutathione synthase/RimK-type ligase-like ATP-grasp enzyme